MRIVLTAFALTLFLTACGRETPAPQHAAAPPKPSTTTMTAPVAAAKPAQSTPQHCAGDGSYQQGVDCFRQMASLHFTFNDGEGEMTRPTPGAEKLRLDVTRGSDRGKWAAEKNRKGVVWTRDGQHTTNVPPALERLFQRVTIYLDPQKKEGAPKLAGEEQLHGESCNRYEFTDANNGDRYTVLVSKTDGRMVQLKVNTLTMSFR